MSNKKEIPRILIIDDLFGRTHPDRRNVDREGLCGLYLLQDVTGDEKDKGASSLEIVDPVAQAVFYRGQKPSCSSIGDTVENDTDGTLKLIEKGWNEPPYWSLVLLDLCFYTGRVTQESDRKNLGMPEGRPGDDDPKQYFGLQILSKIKENYPNLPVVILSSKPEKDVSLDYTSLGAMGFIDRASQSGPDRLRDFIRKYGLFPDESGSIIGHSKSLLAALSALRRYAFHEDYRNILLRGETGTGKKLFAEFAHRQRKDQNDPFVTVNCPQHSEQLYMSELFGHKKGSFTDARDDKRGLIESADGGDVFLDEIANLPLAVQSGLLKVIEERIFYRVGETVPREVSVRFLAATNENLEMKIQNGEFRKDLLYRLTEGGEAIFLPPLRERKDDIPLLVKSFVRDAIRERGVRERTIEQSALDRLMQYDWPGNIRELRSCVYNAVSQNPDVPHLVADHIKLSEDTTPAKKVQPITLPVAEELKPQVKESLSPLKADNLEEMIHLLEDFVFDSFNEPDLHGKLIKLQSAYAQFIAKYLKACLDKTSKYSLESNKKEVLIHPALKLMMGDPKLPASEAAAIIKRLLKIDQNSSEHLLKDNLLKEANEIAENLRPKSYKKKKDE